MCRWPGDELSAIFRLAEVEAWRSSQGTRTEPERLGDCQKRVFAEGKAESSFVSEAHLSFCQSFQELVTEPSEAVLMALILHHLLPGSLVF